MELRLKSKKVKDKRGDIMARLSDTIEDFIKSMFDESLNNEILIQRNELANVFKCAPSQINYVLTTRFSYDKGYYIESKRGGGGCIKIIRADYSEDEYIKEIILKNIKDKLSQREGFHYIDVLGEKGLITQREQNIMKYCISDNTLGISSDKDFIRSSILKAMLISMLS